MNTNIMQWEQRNKPTLTYQEDIKTKYRTFQTINGKFPLGTASLVEALSKDGKTYTEYEAMRKPEKKKYEIRASEMTMTCLFMRGCKQHGDSNMEANLSNLYGDLDGKENIYPETLADAAERYEMSYCKARKNGNNSRNKKSGEEEKEEGNGGGQASGAHFEVEMTTRKRSKMKKKPQRPWQKFLPCTMMISKSLITMTYHF